ncbi:hypothetical protein STEG23_014890, partial [Scotinomys teguina]
MSDWMRECDRNKTCPSPALEVWTDSIIIVCEERDRPILSAYLTLKTRDEKAQR